MISMIYNRNFDNNIQKNTIDNCLDIKLTNNEILLTKHIYSFLSDKCEHCKTLIINPQIINGKYHVCDKCINYYIYCGKDKCKNIIFNPKYIERCKHCLSWYCKNHQDKCHCKSNNKNFIKKVILKFKKN